jgi:tetratricopeptide (TPR) repeat protein
VQTLRRRAKLQLDDEQRVALYRRARELADALGDRELAEAVLREVLTKDDTNLWALSELTVLREAQNDFKETFSLLLRRVEIGTHEGQNRELLPKAAGIACDRLNDADKAIELYGRLFEEDPADTGASRALRALYEQGSKHQDLARLLERLIDVATTPGERGTLRMELSALRAERDGAVDSAVDLLRAVLEEEPARADAVRVLGELYERLERYEDLSDLLGAQISQARDRGDTETELSFLVRLGDLFEARLKNRPKAIETYESILARHAGTEGARITAAPLPSRGRPCRRSWTLRDPGPYLDGRGYSKAMTTRRRYKAIGDLGSAAGRASAD